LKKESSKKKDKDESDDEEKIDSLFKDIEKTEN